MSARRFLLAGIGGALGLLLCIPLVVLAAPFWFVSAVASLLVRGLGLLRARATPWVEMIAYEPEIGWRPKAGLKLRVRAERTITVTTDADGWRGAASIDESDVLVFGDSFAFGHGTDDRFFFADRVHNAKVKALGADGYNMVQELLWMRRLGRRLDGKLVVWLVFYGNDLFDNLTPDLFGYRQPFVRKRADARSWEIVTEHVSEAPWPRHNRGYHADMLAEICTPTYRSRRAFAAADALIGWADEIVTGCGGTLVVVGAPDPAQVDPARVPDLRRRSPDPARFDPHLPDRSIRQVCEDLGVGFETLTGRLEPGDFLLTDVHWTPDGNRRLAQLIEELLRDRPTSARAGERRPASSARSGAA